MKCVGKVMLLAAVLTLSVSPGYSQDGNEEKSPRRNDKLTVGIKLGANYANVYDDEGEDFVADPKTGFAGGGFFYIPIVRFIGFQPEVMYTQKGFRGTGTVSGDRYDLERTTSHIDVPLMLGIKPLRFVTLLAGPHYSYLLSQRDLFSSSTMSIDIEQQFEQENIRKNTMGVIAGIDINLLKFVFSARSGWDMTFNRGDGTSETPRYKNVWVQGTVGLKF